MNFNQSPYFDDFDNANKYYRILYRPSFAVQGRELTQSQTILTNQIKKFADHIFEEGAMVIPGQVTYDNTILFSKMETMYGSYNVDPTQFLGFTVVGESSGIEAYVMNVASPTSSDPLTFFFKNNNSGTSGEDQYFYDGETIHRKDDPTIKAKLLGGSVSLPPTFTYSGKAGASSISAGIYYIRDMFVDVDAQSIIVSKYDVNANKKIGLRIYEEIVTPEEQAALNDNSTGSPNYAAPGAHRYKITLRLETLEIDEDPSDSFIEIQRIRNGIVVKEIRTTDYSELEKTFARRTYDESGDYTVNPFSILVREHLRIDGDEKYKEGVYYASEGGDSSKLVLEVSPGKAYVRGFEINKIAKSNVTFDKARDTDINNNSVTPFLLGNYLKVDNLHNVPDISSLGVVNLYDTVGNPGQVPSGGNLVGHARIRAIENKGTHHNLYMFDIEMIGSYSFEDDVKYIYDTNGSGNRNFSCNSIPDSSTSKYYLQKTSENILVFKLPHKNIKTLSVGGAGTDTNYSANIEYMNVGVISNKVTLSAPGNSVFEASNGLNYYVANGSNGNIIDNSTLIFTLSGAPTGNTLEITGAGLAGLSSVNCVCPLAKQLAGPKIKHLQSNQQVIIANPNTVNGNVDYLGKADVIGVRNVYMSNDFTTIPTTSDTDITDRYETDTGQRDNYYDVGSIKLKNGSPAPTGQLLIIFDYFTHTNDGDYFCVDSYVDYISSGDFEKIPHYVSRESGDLYNLADVYDFRPRMADDRSGFSGVGSSIQQFPQIYENISSDYEYYLNRIDYLFLDYKGEFNIQKGISAIYPKPPKTPENAMIIYELFIDAYTYNVGGVSPIYRDNRRYTMRDIGKIDKRVTNLEYYTTLSLLERETATMEILDSNGLSRFKNGFIVDPFTSHKVGYATHPDYSCCVFPSEGQMRPSFEKRLIDFDINKTTSSNYEITGSLVTLPYTNTPVIQQMKGSVHENVNPFAVRTFKGEIKFNPDSDNWYETKDVGELIVNNDAHFQALKYIADHGKGLSGTEWNEWETQWASSSTVITTSERHFQSGDYGTKPVYLDSWHRKTGRRAYQIDKTITATTTTTVGQERKGTKKTHYETTINKDLGERTVGINYIPYMRSIPVLIKTEKLKPNTILYPFFDDVDVSAYCVPAQKMTIENKVSNFHTKYFEEETVKGNTSNATAVVIFSNDNYLTVVNINGTFIVDETITGLDSGATAKYKSLTVPTNIVSGDKGEVGLIFTIPNNDTLKFKTGERKFVLNDQPTNADANQTYAEGIFKAQGSMLHQENTVLSTKTIRFSEEPVRQFRTQTKTSSMTTVHSTWFDPLAQTFLIEETGGCFITKLEVYFQSKDDTLPVTCQIRDVVNGYPGQTVVPYSEVTLNPEQVIASAQKPGSPTVFEMDAPVYLQEGHEYCFVILSDAFNYNVWVGEVGQIDLVSGEIISKQPYNGVLFKSQNASTWTANQMQDMMFTLYKAQFDNTVSGSVIIENKAIQPELLDTNPIETVKNSEIIRIHHPNHGMILNSKYTLSGLNPTTNYNGFLGSQLNGVHDVTDVEMDSFTFVISGTSASDTGITGGDSVYGIPNYQMDVFRPNMIELSFDDTVAEWQMDTTTHRSVSGNQTPYSRTGYVNFINNENYMFNKPMMVASEENETNFLTGNKSLKLKWDISTNNKNVSPVLDKNRFGSIIVNNRIDKVTTEIMVATAATFTVGNGENTFVIHHNDHGKGNGSYINISGFTDSIAGTSFDPNGLHEIKVVDKDTYLIEMGETATSAYNGDGDGGNGGCSITHSNSHYIYIPEVKSEGCSATARYLTIQCTLDDPAESFKLFFGAVREVNASITVYYKIRGPYETAKFEDIDWVKIDDTDETVPISDSNDDFKDYTYTVDNLSPYNSLSVKLVMESTDSTQVPIFTDLRLICTT